jgi:hypothetical protein
MAERDVFNYENNIKTEGQVASADFARIAISRNNTPNALVQSVEVQYRQAIEEVTQVGDTQIYWLPGRPQGTIGIQSLVGADGFFNDWKGECGKIDTASIKLRDGQCQFKGSGTITFKGGVVESLTANLSTGRQTIAQGANIRVAHMRSK